MDQQERPKVSDELQKQMVRNARTTAVTFGICTIITLIFGIYGYTQSIHAQMYEEIAMDKERKALICEQDAMAVRDRADSLQKELDACRASQK